MAEAKMLKITLRRSEIGSTQRQRQTLRGLGLMRVGQTVIVHANAPMQGRIRAVQHLVEVKS
jgi:large subunit ribosomal protein L30